MSNTPTSGSPSSDDPTSSSAGDALSGFDSPADSSSSAPPPPPAPEYGSAPPPPPPGSAPTYGAPADAPPPPPPDYASAPPPPPGYAQPGAPVQAGRNSKALWALISGIVGIVLGLLIAFVALVGGVAALILGRRASREIAASGGAQTGAGMAKAGAILGIVAIALFVFSVLATLALRNGA